MNRTRASAFAVIFTIAAAGHAWAAAGPHAHDHGHAISDHTAALPYGEPGDPKKPARPISVVMTDGEGKMAFIPAAIEVRQGDQIRFMLRNNGVSDHELVLGTLETNLEHARDMAGNPDMKHEEPNARRLEPKKTGEILWRFTKVGEFDFSCLIPGHREAGMTGKIIVKP
ncbi:cupredoxin family protein [Roseiarcaceae bacterium H3SJ34-1]|uniref:cupredoxin domain-containing protein n=1 Tax=Terripilifer ovatus TaxID=3032367 RepID=UPI003AB93A5C|nr:cupredoxin family protein [Roseiarcaceae bacterium H3SJ34-1]